MKSKEIKRYNLPNDRIVISKIDAKPYELLAIVLLVAFIVGNNTQWYYGFAIALLFFLMFVAFPNRILVEFTHDYMVFYNKGNAADCVEIYYEDVVSWKYITGFKQDELIVNLIDGTSQKLEAFSKPVFELSMNRFLKDKKEKK